ncbi:MAG: hypothetical protein HYX67_07855 [Candidatus Melainabacteria bacterium]|nr:hypothetical protein [Candidatus Melainabacteria bacterium]
MITRFVSKIVMLVLIAITIVPTSLPSAISADTTIFKDPNQRAKLIGKHLLSLQWLQFENNMYGSANVVEKEGVLLLKGEQRLTGKEKGYLTVDGRITEASKQAFKFNGKIVTSVSHINDGKECVREGSFNFLAKGNRKYWRLQEMQSPCSTVTDYVDLYFR